MNHYIKHVTERVTSYMNLSPEEKQQRKLKQANERKERRHGQRSQYSHEWFGIVPFVVKTLFKK